MDEKDTASRKWQLTFNNPAEHGWTHDKIREGLRTFRTVAYRGRSKNKPSARWKSRSGGLENWTPLFNGSTRTMLWVS